MRYLSFLILLGFVALITVACDAPEVKQRSDTKGSGTDNPISLDHSAKALSHKKVKLFIGQDLNSIRNYVRSGQFPNPTGVTTYLSFYNLLNSNFPAYGGLGLDSRGYPTNKSVDWGAGSLNALALANEYPNAALNIGLNIAEGSQSISWERAQTQRQLATELVQFARLKQKPLLIAEASPQGYDLTAMTKANISPVWDGIAGQNVRRKTAAEVWREWYEPFFKFIRNNRDVIRAVSYINADWDAQDLWGVPYSNGYWGDSRVQMNPEISKLWSREVSDKAFWFVK